MPYRRPLIPCTLAYATGLWLTHDIYHTSPTLALLIAAALIIAAIILTLHRRDTAPILLILLTALGATIMASRERQAIAAAQTVTQLSATPGHHIITGTIRAAADLPDTDKSRIVLSNVRVTSGTKTHTIPGRVQLNADHTVFAKSQPPTIGETITFPGRITPPSALQNFLGYDRLEYLRHEQIYASAIPLQVTGIIRTASTGPGLQAQITSMLTTFRKSIAANLTTHLWAREGRLMNAMLFNDMRSLTDDERQIFRESGTFHLFAVSGMHVAILGLVLNLIFRAMRFGPRGSWIAVAISLFIYLWLIDFVPSATRSYLMLFAFTAAYMLGREVDSLTALWFAIAVVVAVDPAAPWKAGFVLSVLGVAAIILFTPLLRSWFPWTAQKTTDRWRGLFDNAMEALFATIAITIVLYPIQVYYFGYYNILSPLANLLQAALSSAVLSAGLVSAIASHTSDTLGQLVGHSSSLIMKIIFEISRSTAHADWAMTYYSQMPLWLMLTLYALLASGYYLVHKDTPEFPLKARARFATHVACSFGLLIGYQAITRTTDQQLHIWCFDVGQGDSTLIKFKDGKTMLIDAGIPDPDMGRLVVVPQLRGLGIDRLDYIVATHDDIDHTGGLASVIENIPTNYLMIPETMAPKPAATDNNLILQNQTATSTDARDPLNPARQPSLSIATRNLFTAAKKHHCVIIPVAAGHTATAGECKIEILNPTPDPTTNKLGLRQQAPRASAFPQTPGTAGVSPAPPREAETQQYTTTRPYSCTPFPLSTVHYPLSTTPTPSLSDNDQSLVLRLTYGKFTALLMADATATIESRLLNQGSLTPVTFLKVAHHGSNTGTTTDFLKTTRPKITLISCGASNRFNHPHPDLLRRLAYTNSTIYRTDQNGALHLATNGQTVKTHTAAQK